METKNLIILEINEERPYEGAGHLILAKLASKEDLTKPTHELPLEADHQLEEGMEVLVTPHTTPPNENGGTTTTYEVNPVQ